MLDYVMNNCKTCGAQGKYLAHAIKQCDNCWGSKMRLEDIHRAWGTPVYGPVEFKRAVDTFLKQEDDRVLKQNEAQSKDKGFDWSAENLTRVATMAVGAVTLLNKLFRVCVKYWPVVQAVAAQHIKEIRDESPEIAGFLEHLPSNVMDLSKVAEKVEA